MSSRSSLLRASAAATLLLANAALPAAAGPAPALALAPDAGTAAGAKATVPLKHLPAGRDELMFRGESAHRSWSVYLGRGETERAKTFQLALKNAVAALPDQSSVRLSINGRVVANVPTRSPNSVAIVPVAIPPGLLVPGFNKVDVSTVMLHRVDCSVAASYELWTELDPAQTGFLVPAVPASAVRSIEDVAAEPLADDGTARIHLRSADYDDAAGLARAGRLITALVRRAGLARPVVDVGPEAGRGPGVDVVLATGKAGTEASRNLRILGREDDVTFARDPASERLVLLLSGADAADLDRQVDAFAAKGARLAPAAPVGEMAVEGETRRSFADLGLQTEAFSGRHYAAAIDVVLPSDFYPANYDRAQVRIDGTYARNLDPDNALVFRVNGALVSSLHLGPDREGVLDHDLVELPLRFFHPGHNAITFEAATTTPADRQCDTASLQRDVRFTLGGTSEIAFPRFAHLGTVPQIPGAMAGSGRGGLNLYLSQTDAATVGAGLTMLANIGARGGELRTPVLHVNPPAPSDAPGIVVGALDVLPAALAGPVRALTTSPEADAAPEAPAAVAEATPAAERSKLFDLSGSLAKARRLLQNQGFFFGSDQGARTLPFSTGSLLIAAIDPRPSDRRLAGIDLPQFTSDSAQWLAVTASEPGTLQAGLTRLVADGRWAALGGQGVSLNAGTGALASVQPARVLYVVPERLVLSDLRPILGGIVSNSIEVSLVILILLMTILGVSTHVLIRRSGVK